MYLGEMGLKLEVTRGCSDLGPATMLSRDSGENQAEKEEGRRLS